MYNGYVCAYKMTFAVLERWLIQLLIEWPMGQYLPRIIKHETIQNA